MGKAYRAKIYINWPDEIIKQSGKMKKQSLKKAPKNRKYFYEIGIVAVLLAGVLGAGYYSDFVSTGYAIQRLQGVSPEASLPSSMNWAGVPWALFKSNGIADIDINETLIMAVPDPAVINNGANFNITAQGDYVWNKAWFYDGAIWRELTFTADPKRNGSSQYESSGWITKAAISTINGESSISTLPAGKYWFAAYTCQYVDSQWKCGCRTESDCGKWQTQNVVIGDWASNIDLFGDYMSAPPAERPLLAQQITGGQPITKPTISAWQTDFSLNGKVDFADFFLFADNFGLTYQDNNFNASYDLDNDLTVDFDDFFAFADHFGKTLIKIYSGGSSQVIAEGTSYNISMIGTSSASTAVIKVGTEQKTVSEGSATLIGGLNVFADGISQISITDQGQNSVKLSLWKP